MQKLIYENIRGEQVVFCHAPYVLASLKGMGLIDVDMSLSAGAYQQGESLLGFRREKRTVQLTLHVMAQSRQEMYRLRSYLCGILSPGLALEGHKRARLIYENDDGVYWTWAMPESGLDWGKRILDIQPSVTLRFVCESPFWFGQTHGMVYLGTAEGFSLPLKLPFRLGKRAPELRMENQGQTEAPVRLWLTGSGETPVLINQTTGAVLRLIQPLPVGDVLAICTEPGRLSARVHHGDGTEENGFGLLDPTASLRAFTLRPGVNRMIYDCPEKTARTQVRLEWNDCYEGV